MPQTAPIANKLFVAAFPTPNTEDKYLYYRVQTFGTGVELPDYGDPVPKAFGLDWPDYFCVALTPDRQAGDGWTIVTFAKKRDNQDAYNYDVAYVEGVNAFPTITRTYVYLRSEYAKSGPLAVGTADPGVMPDAAEGTSMFPGAILSEAEKMVEGTGDPHIDSLFVRVLRKFQHIPALADAADLAAAKTFGYLVEYPYGRLAYPRVTWKIPCDDDATVVPLTGTCPIPGYTASTFGNGSQALLAIDQSYRNDKGVVVALLRTYECNPGPVVVASDNEPRTGTSVLVTKQIVAASSIPATAALLNAEMNGYGTVALTSIVNGLGTTGAAHGLSVGQEFYLSGATIGGSAAFINGTATGAGAYFAKTVPSTTTFTFAMTPGGAAFSGTDDDATGGTVNKRTLPRGTTIEYKAMGMDALRAIRVVSSIDIAALDYLQGASDTVYTGSESYTFPDVLNYADWVNAEATSGDDERWDFNAVPDFGLTEGYRGPCRARITERYTSNPASPAFLAGLPSPTAVRGGFSTVGYIFTRTTDSHAQALARVFPVPNSIHGAISMGDNGFPVNDSFGYYFGSIPATPTTATPTGWLVVDVKPEKWKFGMWVYRIIEIIHP